jgi:hypothetical protein
MIDKPRLLKAEEIEVRPAHKVGDKIAMLLYIDSRAVTKLLDEWVGNMNWQSEFHEVAGQIVGKLGIWDENKHIWVYKSDVGSESNIEAQKGLISDCYKRLLSRWGTTELYSSPDLLLPDDGYGNKGYKVAEIGYNDNRDIIHLVIVNRFNKEVYRWDKGIAPQTNTKAIESPKKDNIAILKEFFDENKRNPNVNTMELAKFKDYYKDKIGEWKGEFNPQRMYERWLAKTA